MKKALVLSFATATLALAGCGTAEAPPNAMSAGHELLTAPVAGQTCLGMVEIQIKQSSFTIDLTEHWRNNANATRMSMPVLQSDYANMREGQELQSNFRSGSFWLNGGKISSRDVTVRRKLGYICE